MKFNRKNLIKFANSIFYEKDGWEHYTHLCKGDLTKKNKNGELHCILGEMKVHFGLKCADDEDSIINKLFYQVIGYVSYFDDTYSDLYDAFDELPLVNDKASSYYARAKACKKKLLEIADLIK